jgi:hypothetical protein
MRRCPSCGEQGIWQHSVLASLDALEKLTAATVSQLTTYARCRRCQATFRHQGPDTLVPEPAAALADQIVWMAPPWQPHTDETGFQMSWDLAEHFFEDQAREMEWLRPLCHFLGELRAAGYGTTLRAGQSLVTLGLSRSREHGLRPEQSYLFVQPRPDGQVMCEGTIAGQAVRLGPVAPTLAAPLRSLLDALVAVDID